MRLIDADAFLGDSIKSKRFVFSMYDAFNDQYVVETVYKDLAEALNAAPTIDAEPVVRCNMCKYYEDDVGYCNYHDHGMDWDDYCSRGAKMDEEVEV